MIKEIMRDLMMDYHYENVIRLQNGKEDLMLFPFAIGYVLESLKQKLRSIPCIIKGHAWEEKSVINLDHASIHLECKRCGETYTHIWY